MSGFIGSISQNNYSDQIVFSDVKSAELIIDVIQVDGLQIQRRSYPKFLADKAFDLVNDFVIVFDGVLLNKKALFKQTKTSTVAACIRSLYKENGKSFLLKLRGSYTGLVYDKVSGDLFVFADPMATKQLYYAKFKDTLLFATSIDLLVEFFKRNNVEACLSNIGAYQLLTIGFTIESNTLFKQIKRVPPGRLIHYKGDDFGIEEYHRLKYNYENKALKDSEIIDKLDELFRNAVKMALDKDKEYGFKHLISLSAGLDSRMTTIVANDLGYDDEIINYTFSQSGFFDEITSKKMSAFLKHEWIFKPLDNGNFLKNIEEVVRFNGGSVLYYGASHVWNMMKTLNDRLFGIVHIGMIGDAIIGDNFCHGLNERHSIEAKLYSETLVHRIRNYKHEEKYNNLSQYKMYARALEGVNFGAIGLQQHTEVNSPFLDLDFIEFCNTIPIEKRKGNYIYDKWIIEKYPKMARFKHNGVRKIGGPNIFIKLGQRKIHIKNVPQKAKEILFKFITRGKYSSSFGMNPLSYWYKQNSALRNFWNSYYEENIMLLEPNQQLFNDCQKLFKRGNGIEIVQVLTLLAAIKLFHIQVKEEA